MHTKEVKNRSAPGDRYHGKITPRVPIVNINGVRTCKLDNPQFSSKLCSDIIILNETHASSNDILNLDGYFCVSNCRSTNPSRLRGGVAVLIKNNLRKGVKIIDKSHTDIVWLKLHKSFF